MVTLPDIRESDIGGLVENALRARIGRPRRSFNEVRTAREKLGDWVLAALRGRAPTGERAESDLPSDPFSRLFSARVGELAANITGNEGRALDAIETLAIDLLAGAVTRLGLVGEGTRTLFVPRRGDRPPALLLLQPRFSGSGPETITDDVPLHAVGQDDFDEPGAESDELAVRRLLLGSRDHVRDALRIAQPEIVQARAPRMEKLCVPAPLICIETQTDRSTAGIYCTDEDGVIGTSACFHGTGDIGTPVTVNGVRSSVARASEVQDIVFIPLPEGVAPQPMPGIAGTLRDRTPSQYDAARFDGLTSGATNTTISSHDAGLLRARPTIQLKVQTPADTNKGDSGSALIDRDGRVIGFAFEKSAMDEVPQITDWIWAANALQSLNLTPL